LLKAVSTDMAEVALTPEELTLYTNEVMPLIRAKVPPEYQARADAAVKQTLAKAKARFAPTVFKGVKVMDGLGLAEGNPKDFNLTTFRKEYTATGWQDSPIANFTTSQNTYLVIVGYEDPEPVNVIRKVQWTVAGNTLPIEDVTLLAEKPTQKMGTEPIIVAPRTLVDLDVEVRPTGWSSFKPLFFVIAPRDYLISRTFLS